MKESVKWEIIGPFIFSFLLILVEIAIKGLGFDREYLINDLAPLLCLWSTGIFFTLSITEGNKVDGKISHKLKQNKSNELTISYVFDLPASLTPSPKYNYFFVIQMGIWIISVLLAQKAQDLYTGKEFAFANSLVAINLLLAGFSIAASLTSLWEENGD
ncbi:hypothetical protein BCY92_16815 [Bacillus wiedmannii]|uniref:hypothetical protein n=1 Tax=Bacillus wiedmannii TaxID=1890302 RepID=UPI000E740681|nr:hypothetical protein BCY92_16815 [Bacillus wiedmannii]